MIERNLFELIDRFRRGGTVTRYHTHRLQRAPNNAEHQWGVAMIVDKLWQSTGRDENTPAYLILAALYHDVAEFEAGDMPAWIKRQTDLGPTIDRVEAGVNDRLGIRVLRKGDADHALLKAADELEHLWTLLDERRLGTVDTTDEMFADGVVRVRAQFRNGLPYSWTAEALAVVDCMEDRYREIGGEAYQIVVDRVRAGGGLFFDNKPAGE